VIAANKKATPMTKKIKELKQQEKQYPPELKRIG
jgi:hypothetical protein